MRHTWYRRLAATAAMAAISLSAQRARGQNQNTLQWSRDPQQAIALAKRTQRPLMFYIEGETRTTNDQVSQSDDIRRAFADPRVLYASRHFIPVKLIRSQSNYKDLFNQLEIPENANLQVYYVNPDGKRIVNEWFSAWSQPGSFAQKNALVFRAYRKKLFEDDLKKKLEDKKTTPTELKRMLKLITDFTITDADKTLLDLIDKTRMDAEATKMAYAALAEISTEPAVDFLLKQAAANDKTSPIAADAMEKCTPKAAMRLVKEFDGDETGLRLAAYKAVVKICRVPNPKPDKFWEGKNDRLKSDEYARVKKAVETDADRWEKRYGEYR